MRARYGDLIDLFIFFFFSSRRRHTRCSRDWSSDVCSSDLMRFLLGYTAHQSSGLGAWNRDTDHIQKAFHFGGMTARSGVTSALVVQAGWTGVEDILSGKDNSFKHTTRMLIRQH